MKRKWLSKLRIDKGITYKVLAEKIGVSQQYIYYLEIGERTPSIKIAKKLGSILNFEWTKFYEE